MSTACVLDCAAAQGWTGLLLLRDWGLPELWVWMSDCTGSAEEEMDVFQGWEIQKGGGCGYEPMAEPAVVVVAG